MNRIEVQAEADPLPPWTNAVKRFMLRVLEHLHRNNWDLSVLFCGDVYIRSLNDRFRQQDEPTDVLSFALGETITEAGECWYLPGDIIISLETLAENARYFKVSPDEELRRLLIHGLLHLDGWDHPTNGEHEPMLQLQEQLLLALADERILPWEEGLP
ncbi:MAG: rRNA maturation RNase YbeY [Treponema sp.]|jgi:probable rRNA maturation factor|nr:rRNA maturation RNase YbeY [Treponema sp.]